MTQFTVSKMTPVANDVFVVAFILATNTQASIWNPTPASRPS